MNIGFHTPYIV
jgi:hypothetical protein